MSFKELRQRLRGRVPDDVAIGEEETEDPRRSPSAEEQEAALRLYGDRRGTTEVSPLADDGDPGRTGETGTSSTATEPVNALLDTAAQLERITAQRDNLA